MSIIQPLKNTVELTEILSGEIRPLKESKKNIKWIITNIINNFKKKTYEIEYNIEKKKFNKSISRNILPSVIKEYPRYIEINGKRLARCIIAGIPEVSELGGYPHDLNPRFINELLNITTKGFNISYNFKLIPIKITDALKQMDDAVYYNAVNQQSHKLDNNTFVNNGQSSFYYDQTSFIKQFEKETLQATSRELYTNKHRMFDTSLIITFWAKNEQELDHIESHIISILNSNRVGYEIPDYRQKETFVAALPYPIKYDFTMTELFTNHAAVLVPTRNPNSRVSESGLYFGKNKVTGVDVVIDLKALVANHILIIGASGSGKTFTTLMLLTRAHDMFNKRIIFIEPKDDVGTNYRAVAEYYGKKAVIIDVGVGKKNINPLEIMFDADSYKNEEIPIHIYDQHADLIEYFFNALFEESLSENMKSYLSLSLRQVYMEKGIIRENPSTWVNAKKIRAFPTIYDLRNIWIKDAESKTSVSASAQALVDRSTKMTERWSYLSNQSDIDLSADFVVIDISNIHGSMQKAMSILVTGIMSMQFRTDYKKETIIAIDEGAVILKDEKLSMFVLRTLTQGRSFNIGLWFITQHTEDLTKANVEVEFKTDIPIKIIMGHLMNKDNISYTKNFFKLNENDCNNLMGCNVGEGLIKVDNEVIFTKFKPSSQEVDMIKGNLKQKSQLGLSESKDKGMKLVHLSLNKIVFEDGICFDSWIVGNSNTLKDHNYEPIRVQNTLGVGPTKVWIRKDIISDNGNGNMIGNESVDHYSSVYQTAGFLLQKDIPVKISHYNGADLVAKINEKEVAFEFEIYSNNSTAELISKKQNAEKTYGTCYFIGTVDNIKKLNESVGEEYSMKRGIEFYKFLQDITSDNENK